MNNVVWENAQEAEAKFWGRCSNTYDEETKQLEIYAPRMRLTPTFKNHDFDLQGKSVIDIGGGPVSLLLKSKNYSKATVIDPCPYPDWIAERYKTANIYYLQEPAETRYTYIGGERAIYDEVWIYNVLQHTKDPLLVLKNAMGYGSLLRIFEWIDVPEDTAHPHTLKAEELDLWLGKKGMVESIDDSGTFTKAYYNVIKL